MTKEEIQRRAAILADDMDKQVEYIRECARINRGVAEGLYDVYTIRWPKHPGGWSVEPVVWIMPDGSSIVNEAAEPEVLEV